jgi:hypothetical protein
MNDDFKQDLLQQIDSIESEIDDLNHELELDESISSEKWKQYDTRISKLYTLLQHLKEDIYFA